MYLSDYIDTYQFKEHVQNGYVSIRPHNYASGGLSLAIACYTKKAIYEQVWDDVTTRCRGLIYDRKGIIISRPFEKFFNSHERDWNPTDFASQPVVMDKLDGSLGILYRYPIPSPSVYDPAALKDSHVVHGIATKGSFDSPQARWATGWYNRNCINPQWPEGWTPLFEIINEMIEHHVVHYYGQQKIVLIGMVNNETGEEADYNTLYYWALLNGLEVAQVFSKTLEQVLAEDRPNHEGYVLSYPRPGQTPFKVKIKHQTFLTLQKVVHASKVPSAILDALKSGDGKLLDTWIGQADQPHGQWVRAWMLRFNAKYGELLVRANAVYRGAMFTANSAEQEGKNPRKAFAEYVNMSEPALASICFSLLSNKKNLSKLVWKKVEEHFEEEMKQQFSLEKAA